VNSRIVFGQISYLSRLLFEQIICNGLT